MEMQYCQEPVRTSHSLRTNDGIEIHYTATVAEVALSMHGGEPCATVFSFAYTQEGAAARERPVVFLFGGGPGSASQFMHYGGLGPMHTDLSDRTPVTLNGLSVMPNPHSLLAAADLVFVDTPGTGHAKVLAGQAPGQVLGVEADVRMLAGFVRQWLSANDRWASPKYLLGESYGTIRVGLLAQQLMGSYGSGALHGAALDGVILLGQILNYSTAHSGNADMHAALLLPTMVAVAWKHKKVCQEMTLHEALAQARRFVRETYLGVLFEGNDAPTERRETAAARLEALTSIPAPVWLQSNLRLDGYSFAAMLLAGEGHCISAYDGRYVGPRVAHAFDPIADDPLLTYAAAACGTALQQQLSGSLACPINRDYVQIDFGTFAAWDYAMPSAGPLAYLDVGPALAATVRRTPGMRVFVGAGAYDFVTPLGSAEHMLAHCGFPKDRVHYGIYEAGHFPYMGAQALQEISADLKRFLANQ